MTRDVTTSTRATPGSRALRSALDDCQAGAPGPPRATHPDGEGGIPPLDLMAVHCRPMPFPTYLALPRDLGRAEYVNGWTVVSPPPTVRRQRVCQRLSRVLQRSILSPAELVRRTGWQIRSGELVRVPDVMVLAKAPEGCLVTDPPLIVVEVLEGGEEVDLVVKSGEYLHAGAEQLWVVDLTRRVVEVSAAKGPGWASLAQLTARRPGVTVEVGGLRPIELSVTEILG